MVHKWDYFAKHTVGKQCVKASGSVDDNISEGFGRYTSRDSRNFYSIARGSLHESYTWLTKAYRRSHISENEFEELQKEWTSINFKMINFIKAHSKLMENK